MFILHKPNKEPTVSVIDETDVALPTIGMPVDSSELPLEWTQSKLLDSTAEHE